MKIARLSAVAISMLVLGGMFALGTHAPALAQPAPASSSPALPEGWDSKIPLPSGAVLITSTVPKDGIVHSADFSVPGNYHDLVSFYETELPKAGFAMGPKVAVAARKVYNRTFNSQGGLDSVMVSPAAKDPSKFTVHVAWSAAQPKPKSSTP